MIKYALIDLDETLYPRSAGVLQQVGQRIERYLVERMGMTPAQAAALRVDYRDRYGTTLGGLRVHYTANTADYLAFVHDVPIEQLLQPDPELDAVLSTLPWECVIFTNSYRPHVERVLCALGIRQHFFRIFDVIAMGYKQKPDPAAYRHVLTGLGAEAAECLLADDSLGNLIPAKALGMTTVWVGPHAGPVPGVDFAIPEVKAIRRVAECVMRKA